MVSFCLNKSSSSFTLTSFASHLSLRATDSAASTNNFIGLTLSRWKVLITSKVISCIPRLIRFCGSGVDWTFRASPRCTARLWSGQRRAGSPCAHAVSHCIHDIEEPFHVHGGGTSNPCSYTFKSYLFLVIGPGFFRRTSSQLMADIFIILFLQFLQPPSARRFIFTFS